jgi:beta-galactosidase
MFEVNDRRASFLGEFGGLGHAVPNHVWQSERKVWGYGGTDDTATREGLQKTYLGLMEQVREFAAKGLAGSVYTQTTDVENEINGLMTYDRKVLKYDAAALAEAHRRVIEAAVE